MDIGIKTYDYANRSKDQEYQVENRMQTKARMYGLEQQRNGLQVASLGDKAYKYPEYQSDFYKDGGLIAGSTSFKQRGNLSGPVDLNKGKSVFTKPMWAEKVKMDEKKEEADYLNNLDDW